MVEFRGSTVKNIKNVLFHFVALILFGEVFYNFFYKNVLNPADNQLFFYSIVTGYIIFSLIWLVHIGYKRFSSKLVLNGQILTLSIKNKVTDYDISSYIFDTNIFTRYYYFVPITVNYQLMLNSEGESWMVSCNFLDKSDFNRLITTIRKAQKTKLIVEESEQQNTAVEEKIAPQVFQLIRGSMIGVLLSAIFLTIFIVFCVVIILYLSGLSNLIFSPVFPFLAGIFLMVSVIATIVRRIKMPLAITVDAEKMCFGQKIFYFNDVEKVMINPVSDSYSEAIHVWSNGKKYS